MADSLRSTMSKSRIILRLDVFVIPTIVSPVIVFLDPFLLRELRDLVDGGPYPKECLFLLNLVTCLESSYCPLLLPETILVRCIPPKSLLW